MTLFRSNRTCKFYLQDIEKHYETTLNAFALRIPKLEIGEGELFALLGPSGCGKTTLLKVGVGLLRPDQGGVYLENQNITELPAEKRGFGMVFQQPRLFPHMLVEENVAFSLKMQGVAKKERLKSAYQMLEAVGLSDFAHRLPAELSGGQQQRVSLARALVTRPKVLFMDEPLSSLDPELREEMRDLVSRLHQEYRLTILFVTHDVNEAFSLADRIGIMKEGQILQEGTPQELYEQPRHPEIALSLGAKNVIEGELVYNIFQAGKFQMKMNKSSDVVQKGWIVLHPECLKVLEDSPLPLQDFVLQGRVDQISFQQGFYALKISVHSKSLVLAHSALSLFRPNVGQTVLIEYDPRQIIFIPRAE